MHRATRTRRAAALAIAGLAAIAAGAWLLVAVLSMAGV
jgi:hypothetical protein